MGAPKHSAKYRQEEKKNPLVATHDWVLVMNEKGKKSFQWVPKNRV